MTTQTLHPRAAEYLVQLRRAAKRLPRQRAAELQREIEAHLFEALPPEAGEADVLDVLARLGAPEQIVAAEWPTTTVPADPRGTREWAAIVLVLLGGFAVGIGWIVGLVFLWSSRAWKTWEKLLATLIVPGGLAGGLWLAFAFAAVGAQTCVGGTGIRTVCSSGPSPVVKALVIAGLVVLVLGPIATAIFLSRRGRTPAALR